MANNFRVDTYRSAKPLSVALIALFAAQVGCYALYILLSIVQIAIPDMTVEDGEGLTLPFVFIGLISIVESLLRLATIVIFLIWLYRVYSNLSPLRARDLEFTPGWAVGWWFIPLANLIKPYQAVTEAWRESDPDFDPDLGYLTSSVENSWHFPIWWGSLIIGNLFSRIADAAVQGENVSESYPYLLIIAVTFTGIAAALALWIVKDTTRRQDARAKRIGDSQDAFQPPPPPVFSPAV